MRWYPSEQWALVCRLPHCGGTAANNWLLYADYHTVVVPQRQLTLVCWLPHCGYSIKYPDCQRYRIINRLNSKHQHGKKCNNNPCAWIIPRMCVGGQAKFKIQTLPSNIDRAICRLSDCPVGRFRVKTRTLDGQSRAGGNGCRDTVPLTTVLSAVYTYNEGEGCCKVCSW